VVISSPHVLHYEHAVASPARGCHVLVEKPLTTTAADARDLMAKADAAGRQVIVPTGWNFKTWTDEARALLAESVADDVGAVGAYIAPVEVRDSGAIKPGNLREHIRSEGVTIDLPVPA